MQKRILTGDRLTGAMHLGHYFGSLQNRAKLQDEYETFIIGSDWQVLYDHLADEKGSAIEENAREWLLDNLSAGLDPKKVTFFVQSQIPELAELTMIFQFLVSVARAKRNPTVKSEMISSGAVKEEEMTNDEEWDKAADKINVGFLAFPISQAADILLFKANLVPVGADQMAHIEQTREVAKKFNNLFGETFPVTEGLVSDTPRLVGLDGNAKMSKSLGNVINLKSTADEVNELVKKAYSGENCALFYYEKLVDPSVDAEALKEQHKKGEIQFAQYKPQVTEKINAFLAPIRKRRKEYEKDPNTVKEILKQGRERVREVGAQTMQEVKEKMGMAYNF